MSIHEPVTGEFLPAQTTNMPKRLRLSTARDVRRELHRLYTLMMNGGIDTDTARTGGFLLRCSLESLRIDEIEGRLTNLEKGILK
jgi:hypothetical protein